MIMSGGEQRTKPARSTKRINLINEARQSLREQDFADIRERWDKEDNLLASRTSMFLTVNAILFAATRLQTDGNSLFNVGISAIGVILTLLWLKVSKRSSDCIYFLSQISNGIAPVYSQSLRRFREPKLLSPTRVIAVILPAMVLLCWVVLAVLNIGKR
jgi:hypothetical protein